MKFKAYQVQLIRIFAFVTGALLAWISLRMIVIVLAAEAGDVVIPVKYLTWGISPYVVAFLFGTGVMTVALVHRPQSLGR